MFFKIGVLKNSAYFTGKYLCWSLFLIKLGAWSPATLSKRYSNAGGFVRNYEILKNAFFTEHLRWPFLCKKGESDTVGYVVTRRIKRYLIRIPLWTTTWLTLFGISLVTTLPVPFVSNQLQALMYILWLRLSKTVALSSSVKMFTGVTFVFLWNLQNF